MQIAKWIGEGKLRLDEHIEKGIDHAYDAFMMLFSGGNEGKMLLQITE